MTFISQLGKCHIRWPIDRSLEDDLGQWRVAHVKPRNEKALAEDCKHLAIGYYLPLYEKRTRRRDNNKPRKSIIPLFPGYLPFVDEDDAKHRLYETNRIVHILDVPDQQQFVEDLTGIWQAVSAGVTIGVEESYSVGQKVRVKEGPLQGLIGVILDNANKRRLLLNVEAFRMAVSVELDREDIEPL